MIRLSLGLCLCHGHGRGLKSIVFILNSQKTIVILQKVPGITVNRKNVIVFHSSCEAMESAAIMDILECMRMLDSSNVKQAKDILEKLVAI